MTSINALMDRCLAAHAKTSASEDFKTIYEPSWGSANPSLYERQWYVGFYERNQGKLTATGPTLAEALRTWLAEYEHHWDAGA